MNFKKLVSLGVVSAMVSTMASSVFAVSNIAGTGDNKVGNLKAFVIDGNSNTLKTSGAYDLKGQETINGATYRDFIKLTGSNTDSYKIYFGMSNDALFGTGTSSTKPVSQKIIQAASSGAIKKAASGEFTNRGVTVETKKEKVLTPTGEYSGAYCVTVKFTNTSSNDQYSAWDITLTGADSSTKVFKLVTIANAMDSSDVSKADVDMTEDGYREYADNTSLKNGAVVTVAELKEMLGKGNYKFAGNNGVDVLSSVSQATVNEGRAVYGVTLAADTVLDTRYNSEGTGKVLKLSIPFFKNENRKVNIDCDNQKVIDLLGTTLADKIVNGSIKRLYVYPISASGYETLAKASGNDGIINTDEVISATVSDSKIVFDMKKGVTDVMISTKEIDTAKLPAVEGVSVSEEVAPTTSGAENEIVAPVISDETTSDAASAISAPVVGSTEESTEAPVVNAPALEEVPAATNAGQQNTGANDVVVLAIALAVISMAAAGVVATKKF